MNYKVGQKVRVALSGGGFTTYKVFPVLEVSEGDVLLDDGSGWGDPLGPFDAKTGVYLAYMMPGWRQKIVPNDQEN